MPPTGNLARDDAARVAGSIDRVNQLSASLNAQGVDGVGRFSGLGTDGRVSVAVDERPEERFQLRAVVCYDGTPFQVLEWSTTSDEVRSVRDHTVDPVDPDQNRHMTTEIVYTPGDALDRFTLRAYIVPPRAVGGATRDNPGSGQNGANIVAITRSTRDSDGNFTQVGAHNWVDDPSTAKDEGDQYHVARFDAAGNGEALIYSRARVDRCPFEFDEEAPRWCDVQPLIGPNPPYDAAGLAAASQRLSDIPIARKAELEVPALPADASCP
jgi:hypothetical protein